MNKPYVKQYNENGEIINPIKRAYLHQFPNTSTRRKIQNGKLKFSEITNSYIIYDFRDKLAKLKNNYHKSLNDLNNKIKELGIRNIPNFRALLNDLYSKKCNYLTKLHKASANKQWL